MKVIYKTVRMPFLCITEDWLGEQGEDGWILCGKRDFNQYIFYKLAPTKTDNQHTLTAVEGLHTQHHENT